MRKAISVTLMILACIVFNQLAAVFAVLTGPAIVGPDNVKPFAWSIMIVGTGAIGWYWNDFWKWLGK